LVREDVVAEANASNVSTPPARSSGRRIRHREMPPARRAVTSLSAASRVEAYSTATSTAIGSVMATMKGIERAKTSTITPHGRPLPARSPNRLAIWLSSIRLVRAPSANTKGTTCSRIR
jgi:hypothetical protein